MGAHNDTVNDYVLFDSGAQAKTPPSSGGTFDLGGRDRPTFSVGAGTYKLPNGTPYGVTTTVLATGSATITNAAGTTVTTLVSGQFAVFMSTGATSWVVRAHSGFYTGATSTQGFIGIPLTSLREVSSAAVGNIAANGGLLASDTTPTLTPINGATNANQIVTWASSNNDVVMFNAPLPPDVDFLGGANTFGVRAVISSGGTSNAVGFTADYHFGLAVVAPSAASGTNQTTTYSLVSALIGDGADLSDNIGSTSVTVLLTPVAHTTDTLRLRSLYLTYKKKLLTA